VLWSWLYFTLKRPDWALNELYVLWASVLLLILGLWRISKLSSIMILPYLMWVTTAGLLNHSTIELNGPFGP
jgi:tryptophan-rich sensory protein